MRVRDHVALSTAGAAALVPRDRRAALGLWAAGVLIDADHYVWFCVRHRRLSPRAAMAYFNRSAPAQHAATRFAHSPAAVSMLLALGAQRRRLLAPAVGVAAHVALDVAHDARMRRARRAALARDGFACQACGVLGAEVGTHVHRQPWLLPSYAPENITSLCGPCHEDAHAAEARPVAERVRSHAPH